jgi:D-alanyl-D-alanine dipeptidase
MKNVFEKLPALIIPLIALVPLGCRSNSELNNYPKPSEKGNIQNQSKNLGKGGFKPSSQPFELFQKNREKLRTVNRQPVSLEEGLRSGQFVEITSEGFSPDQIRLKYTEPNKFGAPIYPKDQKCYFDVNFANQLREAQDYLDQNHKGVKMIFLDCLRPKSAHDIIKQRVIASGNRAWLGKFVAKDTSFHSYGLAADIGISRNNKMLDLGSKFDDFSGKAAYRGTENQKFLYDLCAYTGIALNPSEAWHIEGKVTNNSKIVK